MTTVTGLLRDPDGSLASGTATFFPIGSNGIQLPNVFLADGTVSGESRATVVNGAYKLALEGNASILPAGTRWLRVFGKGLAVLEVPAQVDLAVSASARSSNQVTLTVASGHGITAGMLIDVDVATASFDGTFTVASTSATTIVYTQTGVDESGGAGTVARAYREHEILSDEPASLQSPALSAHAADQTQHGGGRELMYVPITVETSTTGGPVSIASGSFVIPEGPYEVEFELPVKASASGVIVYAEVIDGALNTLVDDFFRGGSVDEGGALHGKLRVPTERLNHDPVPGTTVTYTLQLGRAGTAGTASTRITGFGFVVRDAWLRAKTT